jgi:hypothetical protein
MRRPNFLLALSVLLTAAACGSGSTSTQSPAATPTADTTSASPAATPGFAASVSPTPDPTASASPAPDDTVWLCKPGLAANPCEGNLDATVVDAAGKSTIEPAAPAANPPIDCFYVYPTVSQQMRVNADLSIDPEELGVARYQVAPFSQVCRVFAPMYPQLTLAAIATPSKISFASALIAYNYVDSAFRSYMANYNHGRGIVFVGHSQGAMMLTGLVKFQVDPNPATRRLLVSALLLGGNITVPIGKSVGGSFDNIPACSSASQTGCVVAYSTFDKAPPAGAVFGRVNSAINLFLGGSTAGLQILCVNPAAPGGGTAPLDPYFPTAGLSLFLGSRAPKTAAATPFISYPGEYSARCISSGGATWLQVDRTGGTSDRRPSLSIAESPTWGLHLVDVNVALGNLVELARSESAAYR